MMLRHGASVAICSRKLQRVQDTAAKLEAATGGKCIALQCDVRDPSACAAVVDATVAAFGAVHILVNGAAGNFLAPAASLSANGFRTVFEIDTLGTFNMSQAVHAHWSSLPTPAQGDNPYSIMHISATLQYRGDPMQVHAAAAKAAIDSMARSMSREWGPHGVRVNCIAPGPIGNTEGMDRLAGWMTPDMESTFLKRIPAGRMGDKADIANAALYLASDAGSYVTGHVLVVDGGMWLSDATAVMSAAMEGGSSAKL